MATGAINPAAILSDPGILYYAPLTTALPSNTVTASKFSTSAWGGGWLPLGSTDAGSQFNYSISTDNIEVAESYDPVKIVTTGRTASWEFNLAEINKQNLKLALNGPTPVTTGSTTTTMTTIAPVAIGSEVRVMIGWQSTDDSVRFFGYQALQIGNIGLQFRKGATKSVIACEFRFEIPAAGGDPWTIYLAGATRG